MIPEQERAYRPVSTIEMPEPTPAEEAKQDIIMLMQEAKPHSPQARAIGDLTRWYGVAIFRGNESIEEHLARQEEENTKVEKSISRKIARNKAYETEHGFALVMIERYTYARSKELKEVHGQYTAQYLQSIVGLELKEMKEHVLRNNNTPNQIPPEKPE
jgi:hypothetical protein